MKSCTVALPTEALRARLETRGLDAEFFVWTHFETPPAAAIDLLVLDHSEPLSALARIPPGVVRFAQIDSLGFDGAATYLPPGTSLCNGAGVHEQATAELAVALTLMSLRGLDELHDAQRRAEWRGGAVFPGLTERTAIVLGNGGVGSRVATALRSLDTTVRMVGRTSRGEGRDRVASVNELPDLLPTADVLIVAVPLDDRTRGMISATVLDQLPAGALVVNVSRGAVVDTAALTDRVASGQLRCALDVVDPEPLAPDHPLWHLPGSIITPHVAGRVSTTEHASERLVAAQIEQLCRTGQPGNIVIDAR